MSKWQKSNKFIGGGLLILAALGMMASLALGYETLETIKNPEYNPSCNISPIISCGKIMSSQYAEIFGVPNPVFGIIGFSALMTLAVVIISGANLHRRMWYLMLAAGAVGVVWVHYLFLVSVYTIGSICPWCSVLWVSTIPIFWMIASHMAASGMLNFNKYTKRCASLWSKYAGPILIVWYLVLIVIVFIKFNDYWLSLI